MNIMQSPFVQKIIQKHYHHFNENEKRNVSIFLILDLMMVFVMGTWAVGFVYLEKWEMFWLDGMNRRLESISHAHKS